MKYKYLPENTLFAFDLHEVIVRPDYVRLILYALRYVTRTWLVLYCFWPPFWIRLLTARLHTRVPEIIYLTLCSSYPRLKVLNAHFITMSNMQLLRHDVTNVIRRLKRHQYRIYLFSNIGPQTLHDIRSKLPLDEFIDGYFTPQEHDNFCHKPQLPFYISFKNHIRATYPQLENIIFIDDKKQNIKTGNKAGLISLRFESSYQLYYTLCWLDILPKES